MKIRLKKFLFIFFWFALGGTFLFAVITVFFDQAVLIRQNTIYHIPTQEKVVAITFDDGPSEVWTPLILDELKKAGVKATFFMLGEHVQKYPAIARRVVQEGHDVGIHSLSHKNFIYYTKDQVARDIDTTRRIIEIATGKKTDLFRPPKAMLSKREKQKIKELGYKVILWSLNSKDWVTFDDKYIVRYLMHYVRPGDIILFHDSGGVFTTEGGKRKETVRAIARLIPKLTEKGYRCVTVTELLEMENAHAAGFASH